jgi:hypothetical protein
LGGGGVSRTEIGGVLRALSGVLRALSVLREEARGVLGALSFSLSLVRRSDMRLELRSFSFSFSLRIEACLSFFFGSGCATGCGARASPMVVYKKVLSCSVAGGWKMTSLSGGQGRKASRILKMELFNSFTVATRCKNILVDCIRKRGGGGVVNKKNTTTMYLWYLRHL